MNGGMLTSSPGDLINWCNLIELHPCVQPLHASGQQWLNQGLCCGRSAGEGGLGDSPLLYCLFLEDQGNELGVKDGHSPSTP